VGILRADDGFRREFDTTLKVRSWSRDFLDLLRRGRGESDLQNRTTPAGTERAFRLKSMNLLRKVGRGERIRTSDPSVPNRVLYQAEPRPDNRTIIPHPTASRPGPVSS
jgi:hypothetical protein